MDKFDLSRTGAEVLCVVGGLAAGHLALGTAEDDDTLLNELERHIWVRMENETPTVTGYLEAYRLHPMMVNVVDMLKEGAPIERPWTPLTGLMIGARSPHPRLHGMIMVNTLSHQMEAARTKATASPN